MNDLVQSQIEDSCKLALPNGLKELMWDISREVLRAQPADLCAFISEYLKALLVTRENAAIAHSICGDVCLDVCKVSLGEELRNIGFSEEDAAEAAKTAEKMFGMKEVNECVVLRKIIELESMTEDKFEAVKDAVCKAYLLYKHPGLCGTPSDVSDLDSVDQAVRHTLRLYRCTKPSDEEYNKAATNIQAAYRAYGVRRHLNTTTNVNDDDADDEGQYDMYDKYSLEVDDLSYDADPHDRVYTTMSDEYIKTIRFHHEDPSDPEPKDVFKPVVKSKEPKEAIPKKVRRSHFHSLSSVSLAGSFVHLPPYKPYTAISEGSESEHDDHYSKQSRETAEKEMSTNYYNEVHVKENISEDTIKDKNIIEVFTKPFSDKDSPKGSLLFNTVERKISKSDEKYRRSISEGNSQDVRASIVTNHTEKESNTSVKGSVTTKSSLGDFVKDTSVSLEKVESLRSIFTQGPHVSESFKKTSISDNVLKKASDRACDASLRASVKDVAAVSIVKDTTMRGSVVKTVSVRNSVSIDTSITKSLKESSVRGSIIKSSTDRASVVSFMETVKDITANSDVKDASTKDSTVSVVQGSIARQNSLEGPLINEQDLKDNLENTGLVKEGPGIGEVNIDDSVRGKDCESKENNGAIIINDMSEESGPVMSNEENNVFNKNDRIRSVVSDNNGKHSSAKSSVIKSILTENNKVTSIEYNIEDRNSVASDEKKINKPFSGAKTLYGNNNVDKDVRT